MSLIKSLTKKYDVKGLFSRAKDTAYRYGIQIPLALLITAFLVGYAATYARRQSDLSTMSLSTVTLPECQPAVLEEGFTGYDIPPSLSIEDGVDKTELKSALRDLGYGLNEDMIKIRVAPWKLEYVDAEKNRRYTCIVEAIYLTEGGELAIPVSDGRLYIPHVSENIIQHPIHYKPPLELAIVR